ncbi:MAG: extracellular solute-binding protein [Treponema sp.]|jgi:ABC-type glycerol-3-phosphate transport system substrate-binding protein|nr:extracellular solute-binding protein [Treponema sp.]
MVKKFWELHKAQCIAAAAAAVLIFVFVLSRGSEQDFSEKYLGADLSGAHVGRTNTYTRYQERYAHIQPAARDISLDIFSWAAADGVSPRFRFLGMARVLACEEEGFVEYAVNLEMDGLYNLYLEYHPLESRGINIERRLKINGEVPFLGAEHLVFPRVWGDDGFARMDNQGNEIRPAQVERPRWERAWLADALGYFSEPYEFYLKEGRNTIRIEGVSEPVAIRALALKAPVRIKTYSGYIAGIDGGKYKNRDSRYLDIIQGEDALYRSDPSLYAIYDRSSGVTEPPSVAKIRLNMIGGQSWRVAGQWIEWELYAPEDGMYRISIKGRQNYNRGFVSNRSVFIDGEIPCKELAAVPFRYDNKWKMRTLRDGEGNDLLFPLGKGRHALRLQVTHGELGAILNVMEESVFRLNEIYRKILILTGTEPDAYRDYRVDAVYPEIIRAMALESKILYKMTDDFTRYTGERSAQAAAALTIARQLELFVRRPDKIPKTLGNFKSNISSLGDCLLTVAQSQLDIDYLILSAAGARLPEISDTFRAAASHEIRSFLASFFMDYNNIGDVYGKNENAVQVWMLAGRDQSAILKGMIDDTFTPQTGIKVNVKLVVSDAVMPAVVAGMGPDVALAMQQADPVNYAVRKAAVDLSKMKGYDELVKQFSGSVMTPFRYAGGVWGLPETQFFNVMFYRKDIFEELGISIPGTWDELVKILSIIQKNNMNVGIPSVAMAELARNDFSNFLAHLYQRQGALYNEDGSRTMLDSETAIEAFDVYTKFFTHYKTPPAFDFVNRFRTGEMPLGFADFTVFNTLEVFAPEIRGLWGFALMPGLRQEDGSIDRSVPTTTLASMIFSNAKHPQLAWEFLTWWLSADTQFRFGRELESVMGAAARHPTANREAFRRLSWGVQQMAVLDEQRSWTVGTREVPGGYFVNRHIINAARRILNKGEDTRETILDYSMIINNELAKKRREFGLE